MEEEIQEKKGKKGTSQKRSQSQGFQKPKQSQIKQDNQDNEADSNLQNSNISFKPKSSLIKNLQVQDSIENTIDQQNFESILKDQKVKKSTTRSQSTGSSKKKFTLNVGAKKKVGAVQLKTAEEKMKNPQLMTKQQSTDIDAEDVDIQQLQHQKFDQPQVQKKKKFKRVAEINKIIDARNDLNENEDDAGQNNSEENSLLQDYEDQMQQMIEEKYGTLLEPNVIPFPKSKTVGQQIKEDKQYQEGSLMDSLQKDQYVLMQFPTKFLYDLNKTVEQRNRIRGVNKDNYGDNKEILNLDVQRKYDSAGNKILQYNGDINHYVDNYQKIDISGQKIGYKLGKMKITKNGECKFICGENSLKVQKGISSNCLQELQVIDTKKGSLQKISDIRSKFVIKPDIEDIYNIQNSNQDCLIEQE